MLLGSHCHSFAIFAFSISDGGGGSRGGFKDLPENVYLKIIVDYMKTRASESDGRSDKSDSFSL